MRGTYNQYYVIPEENDDGDDRDDARILFKSAMVRIHHVTDSCDAKEVICTIFTHCLPDEMTDQTSWSQDIAAALRSFSQDISVSCHLSTLAIYSCLGINYIFIAVESTFLHS